MAKYDAFAPQPINLQYPIGARVITLHPDTNERAEGRVVAHVQGALPGSAQITGIMIDLEDGTELFEVESGFLGLVERVKTSRERWD